MGRLKMLLLRMGIVSLVLATMGTSGAIAQEPGVAARPPMGWNSWDAYGESVKESDIRANAEWMAKNLKAFGWEYIVVDSGWYVTGPCASHRHGNGRRLDCRRSPRSYLPKVPTSMHNPRRR